MIKNMGSADRILRSIAAIVVGVLIFTGAIEGSAAWILGILAVVLLLTSAVSFCPMYLPLKLSTRKEADTKK